MGLRTALILGGVILGGSFLSVLILRAAGKQSRPAPTISQSRPVVLAPVAVLPEDPEAVEPITEVPPEPKAPEKKTPEKKPTEEKAPEMLVSTPAVPLKDSPEFAAKVVPFLQKYCQSCHSDEKHSAGLTLEKFKDEAGIRKDHDTWANVKQNLQSRNMPPKNKPQPTNAERDEIVQWIDRTLTRVDCGLVKDPGRVTMRRLNRSEYNNTIRDLVGVKFQPADDFPADDVGYGFDNIGDVLSMPPILLEKYLAAAEKILDATIVVDQAPKVSKEPFRAQNLLTRPRITKEARKPIPLVESKHSAYLNYDSLFEADYIIRVKAHGDQAGTELPKMALQLDQKTVKTFDVDALEKPKVYEGQVRMPVGKHTIDVVFTNDFADKDAKDPKKRDRNLYITEIELEGPLNAVPKPLPETHQKIMIAKPSGPAEWPVAARKIIETFATRAFRRPVTPSEITRLMKLFDLAKSQNEPFEKCVMLPLKAVLVSPNFLFRIELDREPNNPEALHPVSDIELASRLSYFLWSSMPDDELAALAAKGELRKKGVLEAQVRRMLKDPKAVAMTQNFAGQWLQLRSLPGLTPDTKTFPGYDPALRDAMIRETELYFEYIVKEDRSALEFLDSDYTFLNEKLAKHYAISTVRGTEFRKVTLTDRNRGGVLTHASILTITSNPTRTSPVKRGKWILENILNSPPPPPPPDAGELSEEKNEVLKGSLRQRLEQHRSNPLCATCHQKMDPLGFGLENFNAVGAWRAKDGNFDIDPAGVLPGGESFKGPADLRKVLLGKADLFRKCLAEKLLTYSLGRGLEFYDKCAIDEITQRMSRGQDKFSALVLAIVESDPFQKRRGNDKTKR